MACTASTSGLVCLVPVRYGTGSTGAAGVLGGRNLGRCAVSGAGIAAMTIPHSPKNIVLLDFTLTYENYMRRCQYRLPDHLVPMPQHIDW